MIYVVCSAAYKNKGSRREFESLVKIGYTKDGNWERRSSGYFTHNPTYQLLYTIPGGTDKDEKNLHRYFKRFQKYGEWFIENDTILDFFNTYTTISEIREVLPKSRGVKYRISEIRNYYRPFQIALLNVLGREDPELQDTCFPDDDEVFKWISGKYPDLAGCIAFEFYDILNSITGRISKFIIKLRNTKVLFSDRLRYLCETTDLSPEDKKIVAQQASEAFDKYYNLLGPDQCKAAGYNATYLRKKIEDLQVITGETIIAELSTVFQVGQKYTNKVAKEEIRKIYKKLGVNKAPKATDLSEFFEIKATKFSVSGKWEHGLEILGIK